MKSHKAHLSIVPSDHRISGIHQSFNYLLRVCDLTSHNEAKKWRENIHGGLPNCKLSVMIQCYFGTIVLVCNTSCGLHLPYFLEVSPREWNKNNARRTKSDQRMLCHMGSYRIKMKSQGTKVKCTLLIFFFLHLNFLHFIFMDLGLVLALYFEILK